MTRKSFFILCALAAGPFVVSAQTGPLQGTLLNVGPIETGTNTFSLYSGTYAGAIGVENSIETGAGGSSAALAIGNGNILSYGEYGNSLAVGDDNTLSGSVAFGYQNTVSYGSMVIGSYNSISEYTSLVVGNNAEIANFGARSLYLGEGHHGEGALNSLIVGANTEVNGVSNSLVVGESHATSVRDGLVAGTGNVVEGQHFALGNGLVAPNELFEGNIREKNSGSFIAGRYNLDSAPSGKEYLFVIGNGTSTSARANAMEVYGDGSSKFTAPLSLFNGPAASTPSIELDPVAGQIRVNGHALLVPSSSGYLGIGTTSPTQALDVVGNLKLNNGTGSTTVTQFSNGDSLMDSTGALFFSNYGYTNSVVVGGGGSLSVNSSQNSSFSGTGKVGIGTTSPVAPLDVQAYLDNTNPAGIIVRRSATQYINIHEHGGGEHWITAVSPADNPKPFIIANNTTGAGTPAAGTSDLSFQIAAQGSSGVSMTLQAATGNLGVGTTTPQSLLSVQSGALDASSSSDRAFSAVFASPNKTLVSGTNSGQVAIIANDTTPAANFGGSLGFGAVYDSSAHVALNAAIRSGRDNATSGNHAGYLSFFSRPQDGSLTERMRIASTGLVNIYGGSPTEPTIILDPTIPRITVNGQTLLAQNSSGYVGLGTASPTARLTLPAGTTAADGIAFGDVNLYRGVSTGITSLMTTAQNIIVPNGGGFGIDNNNKIQFGPTGNVNILRDGSSALFVSGTTGSVGLGTMAPTAGSKLDVVGGAIRVQSAATVGTAVGLALYHGDGTIGSKLDLQMYPRGPSNPNTWAGFRAYGDAGPIAGLIFFTSASATAASEKMRITSAGNVGIGTNDPEARLAVTSVAGYETEPASTAVVGKSVVDWQYQQGTTGYGTPTNGLYYIKLADVAGNNGSLQVEGVIGGHELNQGKATVNLLVSTRDTPIQVGSVMGELSASSSSDIKVFVTGTGYGAVSSVYLVTHTWAEANLRLTGVSGQVTLYPKPARTTATPAGTLVYTLSQNAQFIVGKNGAVKVSSTLTMPRQGDVGMGQFGNGGVDL